jgi:cysteine-rich repeat protein
MIKPGATALLLMAAVGGAVCGGEPDTTPAFGNVTLLIQADAGLPVQRIDYEISGRSGNPVKGSVRIDELTRTISANVRGLPVGKGYQLALAAASPDGDLSCTGQAAFEVMPTQTSAVSARLRCTSRSGESALGVVREYCPLVRSARVAPTQTAVGGSVVLEVEAVAPAGTGLTFAWSGGGGSFADPTAASTAFKCAVEGEHVVTVRLVAGTCADRTTLVVKCANQPCGNGRLDPGETCDDGNQSDGDRCPADCVLPGCGNGKLDPQETCEPPGTAACDAQCRKVTGCGNGILDAGETCDDGNRLTGDGCAADCTLEALCGNGQIEPGEACEPPGTATCNALCQLGPSL